MFCNLCKLVFGNSLSATLIRFTWSWRILQRLLRGVTCATDSDLRVACCEKQKFSICLCSIYSWACSKRNTCWSLHVTSACGRCFVEATGFEIESLVLSWVLSSTSCSIEWALWKREN